MFRRIIAAAAIGGTLALGGAGVASAGTTGGVPGHGHKFTCADAPAALARINKLEARGATFVTKAQAREAAAIKAGHTKLAASIAKRIAWVQKREAHGTALLHRIEAACPGATASTGSATHS